MPEPLELLIHTARRQRESPAARDFVQRWLEKPNICDHNVGTGWIEPERRKVTHCVECLSEFSNNHLQPTHPNYGNAARIRVPLDQGDELALNMRGFHWGRRHSPTGAHVDLVTNCVGA